MPPNMCLRILPMLPDNLGILWKVAFLHKSKFSKLNKVQPVKIAICLFLPLRTYREIRFIISNLQN